MSYPLYVAIVWHMHQPLYKDRLNGYYSMPWVRLHGVKDYLDMALILDDFPSIKLNFNLVPSLLEQVVDYGSGRARDRYLELTQIPPQRLMDEEKVEILHSFFDLNWEQMIAPYPRYAQLAQKRTQLYEEYNCDYTRMVEKFSEQELLDLTVWFNLAWIDPRLRQKRHELKLLMDKGQNFSLSDRKQVIDSQKKLISEIIPTYRRFLQCGRIEMTTTPYYHPILPLLADSESAKIAMPDIALPENRFCFPEDAVAQLHKARSAFESYFHQPPSGLWPSEQSLSPEVLPLIAQADFQWLVSSEGILWESLKHRVKRNKDGILDYPEILYRPYGLEAGDKQLGILFRDAHLSDLIGFQYWRGDNDHGAHHLYQQLKKIQYHLKQKSPYPYIVTLALDGENCWEYYREDGHQFLNTFYALLQNDTSLETVCIPDYLSQFPPQQTLDYLHAGSWIGSNFRTWIGDPVKNRAWDALFYARQCLVEKGERLNDHKRQAAWDDLYIAEGSDWFWWFGEGHSSAHDALFDETFRQHLKNIYLLLNEPIPDYLELPLDKRQRPGHSTPFSTMQPSGDY